jgi:uncharacterized membrane protein
MSQVPATPPRTLSSHIRRTFVTGLFSLIPIGITIWVITAIFNGVDVLLQPAIEAIVGRPMKGVGFVATVLLVYLLGLFANNVVGRRIFRAWETFISRIPVVKGLYGGVKQVAEAFGPQSQDQFRDVVMIEFPSPGQYALGFATVKVEAPGVGDARYVFVPTTPNPTSGYLLIVPSDKMRVLSVSVEDGLKLVISGGVVGPESLKLETPRKGR